MAYAADHDFSHHRRRWTATQRVRCQDPDGRLSGTLHRNPDVAALDKKGPAGHAIDDLDFMLSGVREKRVRRTGNGPARHHTATSFLDADAPRRVWLKGTRRDTTSTLHGNPDVAAPDEDGPARHTVDDLDFVRSGIGEDRVGSALNGIRLRLHGCKSCERQETEPGNNRNCPHGSLLSAKCDGCDVHEALRIHPCT